MPPNDHKVATLNSSRVNINLERYVFELVIGTFLQLSISDLAPNYTGSLIAIINTAGNAMGFLTPIVTSAIVDANVSAHSLTVLSFICLGQVFKKPSTSLTFLLQPTFKGWRAAYLLAAGVTAWGATMFLFFGDTKIQEWNYPPKIEQVDLNYRRLSNISTRDLKAEG